jgi:trans-2,3-dihydro-3-hydroxyanthranilate isomerase
MQTLHYYHVDVFTTQRFGGNQLAVFMDAQGLSAELMQTIAREINFSESAFVMGPETYGNDFKLRIFTPQMELPMAGHPTIGTAFVLHHAGIVQFDGSTHDILIEEGVGVVPVSYVKDNDGGILPTMTQPIPAFGQIWENRAMVADLLSLNVDDLHSDYPIQGGSAGVPFLYIPIKDVEAIGNINVRLDVWNREIKESAYPHLFAFTPLIDRPTPTVRSRMFAPAMGIPEDPATGAASGPLGAYLVKYGIVDASESVSIISEQGVEFGRPSTIHIGVTVEGDAIRKVTVGGNSVYVGEGTLVV